jgi:cytochrome P450
MHLQLGEISTIVVSSPKVAREVMKTHDLAFAQRPEMLASKILSYDGSDIAFSPYGDYWRQMRKVCMLELLSAKRVQSFSSLREDEVCNLIESIHSSSGSLINFTEKVFSLTSTIVCRAAFGSNCKDQDAFTLLSKEAISLAGGFELADLFPSRKFLHAVSGLKSKLEKIQRKFDKILDNIINDHRENQMSAATGKGEPWKDDLVDVLLGLQQSGSLEFPITTNNIKAVILVSTPTINLTHSKQLILNY